MTRDRPSSIADVAIDRQILLRCTLVEIGPSRHFAAAQQSVALGGKAVLPSLYSARPAECSPRAPLEIMFFGVHIGSG